MGSSTFRILGVDPAYVSLGLAVVEFTGNASPSVIHSATVRAGYKGSIVPYAASVMPKLDGLMVRYGPFLGIASETPPIIMAKPQVSACIYGAMGVVYAWGFLNRLLVREVHPVTLKHRAGELSGIKYKSGATRAKRKAPIKAAVETALGKGACADMTDHEIDAIMAALCAFGFNLWNTPDPMDKQLADLQ